MTAPWSSTAYTALDGPLEHIVGARIVTSAGALVTALDVLDGDLTFDQDWAPYVQGSLTVKTPTATIDPRLGHRVRIDLGYVYPDGTRDVQQAADLTLTSAEPDLRTGEARLTVQSDEALLNESANWNAVDVVTTYATVKLQLEDTIGRALHPYDPVFSWGSVDPQAATTVLTDFTVAVGARWWSYVQTLADICWAAVWCDENRVWHGDYVKDPGGSDLLLITDGSTPPEPIPSGFSGVARTITEVVERLDRREWANAVVVEHAWSPPGGGSTSRVVGTAYTTTGSYAVGTVGYRTMKLDRAVPVDANGAAASAAAVLRRTIKRGRVLDITCRAAYWIRPRMLVAFDIKGTRNYQAVTQVSYRLDGSGLMTCSTREPV